MTTTSANVIAGQNQTAHGMVSASINVYFTKLHLQHVATAFVYYGTSEGEFKTRYNNHAKSFRQSECMNETEISKHVWNLKDHVLDNNLSFEIHRKAFPYQYGSKRCDLRLSE